MSAIYTAMKIYYFPVAPNPTRVLIYVREKGIDIELVHVSLRENEQNSAEHLTRNPRGTLPVLEMDDGSFITESLPIIEYLEERYPEPCMIGATPEERARRRAVERQAETLVLNPLARYTHATNSPLGLTPNPEVARVEQGRFEGGLRLFDATLSEQPFCCGDSITVADCTLFAGLLFAEFFGFQLPGEHPALKAWYEEFKQRPSAQFA